MKRCTKCGANKLECEFYANPMGAGGLRSECKDCTKAYRARRYRADPAREIERVRDWQQANSEHLRAYRREYRKGRKVQDREGHLRRKFGITQGDYERMLAEQGGGCAICGRPPGRVSLHVDHDHESGRVRGLLCVSCNNALGQLQESHDLLVEAMRYLDRDDAEAELARARARELVRR